MDIITSKYRQSGTDYMIITLRGRIAAFHAPTVRTQFDGFLNDNVTHFVLDLSHVEFLDSAGLAALIYLLKHAQEKGGDVKMIMPKAEDAQRILRLTRFDKVFSIVDTVETALQNF